jgi:hypothetical protein
MAMQYDCKAFRIQAPQRMAQDVSRHGLRDVLARKALP